LINMEKLINIMKELRDRKNGCPWDIEQDFSSIAPFTIEEAYEVADAIERQDLDNLKEELGDLLFQVVFHAQMAAEQNAFDITDVVNGIVDKMIRRHPHVFSKKKGDEKIENAEQQTLAWDSFKEAERKQKAHTKNETPSLMDGVPVALPALTQAVKLQRRAARIGFDWTNKTEIFDKISEELEEVRHEIETEADKERVVDEIGDLFFAVSNLARHLEIDPETAVRVSNAKFTRRFKAMEELARQSSEELKDMSLDEMEALYQQTKRDEKRTMKAKEK